MKLSFKGRAVLPGTTEGQAMVTHSGFNTYASFFTSIHARTKQAICADSVNLELFGKDLADKIICLPKTTGSTSGGAVWQRLSRIGNTPRAMLFSQKIDSLAAGGLIIADIWAGKRLITVDQLGNAFLETVQEKDWITINIDGTVEIIKQDF